MGWIRGVRETEGSRLALRFLSSSNWLVHSVTEMAEAGEEAGGGD